MPCASYVYRTLCKVNNLLCENIKIFARSKRALFIICSYILRSILSKNVSIQYITRYPYYMHKMFMFDATRCKVSKMDRCCTLYHL